MIRVLLVGNHTVAREGVRRILEAEDDLHVVAEADPIAEAVMLTEQLHPDIVVVDVVASRLSATQFVQRLSAATSTARMVVFTDDQSRTPTALVDLGVGGIVSRRTSSRELITAIRSANGGTQYVGLDARDPGRNGTWLPDEPTRRELEVLSLVAQGHSNREIAARLSITPRTVQFHLSHAFAKLAAESRTHAVHLARQRGWLEQ